MPPYAKDSSVFIIRATEDGYFTSVWLWDQSPPPLGGLSLEAAIEAKSTVAPTNRQDRISADKAELISEFTAWVNSIFDQ